MFYRRLQKFKNSIAVAHRLHSFLGVRYLVLTMCRVGWKDSPTDFCLGNHAYRFPIKTYPWPWPWSGAKKWAFIIGFLPEVEFRNILF